MFRVRLRSPLRWLSAVMSALAIFALTGIVKEPWLLLAAPVVALLFLLAPPIGVYRHDETPIPHAHLALVADVIASEAGTRYRLTLVNSADVAAADFRMRLIVPTTLAPRDAPVKPLERLLVGEFGRHWFTETVYDGTAITFRSGGSAEPGAIICPAGARLDLAELRLLNAALAARTPLAYQINGGNVGAVLDEVRLPRVSG